MERITMSPKIFSGYTNPYPKNMKKVLWTEKHQWTGIICKIMNRISEGI